MSRPFAYMFHNEDPEYCPPPRVLTRPVTNEEDEPETRTTNRNIIEVSRNHDDDPTERKALVEGLRGRVPGQLLLYSNSFLRTLVAVEIAKHGVQSSTRPLMTRNSVVTVNDDDVPPMPPKVLTR